MNDTSCLMSVTCMHSVAGLQENYFHPVVVLPSAVWVWTRPKQKPVQMRSTRGRCPTAPELSSLRGGIKIQKT